MTDVSDRRGWIRTTARWMALSICGAMGAILVRRTFRAGCINRGRCGICPRVQRCALPKAVRQRQGTKAV